MFGMKYFVTVMGLLFLCEHIRQSDSRKGMSKERQDKGKNILRGPDKGEPSKGCSSKEEPGEEGPCSSKKPKLCSECEKCKAVPCTCPSHKGELSSA